MKRLSVLLSALLLGACAGAAPPKVATPPPELPEAFFFAPDEQIETDLAALLPSEDPAFAAFVGQALVASPTLGEALARIDQARAGAARAGAERLPDLAVSAGVEATRINPAQFGANLPPGINFATDQTAYAANLSARWDPDLFGALRAQERAALQRIDAAEAGAAAVRLALVAEIGTTVIDWRTLQAQERHLRSDLAASQRLEEIAGARADAGLGAGIDGLRAAGDAAATRTRLAALEGEKRRVIGRLVTLTAQDAGIVTQMLDEPVVMAQGLAAAPSTMPTALLQNRPDVLRASALLAAEDADLAATARRRFPRFDLSAIIGLLAFDIGQLFSEDSIVGTLAASVAAPLIDFGRLSAEVDGAAAEKRAAFEAYRGAVFAALGEAEASYGLVAAADAEAAAALEERDAREKAKAVAQEQYRSGLADVSVLLDATRLADASGQRAAAAEGRARRARVVLWQTLGGDPPTDP